MWHGAPPRMVLQLTTKLNIFKFHMLIKLILFEFGSDRPWIGFLGSD